METELVSSDEKNVIALNPNASVSVGQSAVVPFLEGKDFVLRRQNFHERYGSLEDVRQRLQISKKKMCEILMVNASAWGRWNSAGKAPPNHVYVTLELLLRSQFLARPEKSIQPNYAVKDIGPSEHELVLGQELGKLKETLHRQEVLSFGWKCVLIFNSLALLWVLSSRL